MPSDKSLIYIENKSELKIDPWGIPALIFTPKMFDH